MEYPWSILDLEATDDLKAIKRAYAKLLKRSQPDEHPEQFQELNEAYRYAKQIAQCGFGEDIEQSIEPSEFVSIDTQDGILTDVVWMDNSDNVRAYQLQHDNTIGEIDSFQELESYQSLIFQVDKALSGDVFHSKEKDWHFLAEHEDIFDINYNYVLGLEVLAKIAVYWRENQSKYRFPYKNGAPIPLNVLSYLDDIFQWRGNIYDYLDEFEKSALIPILGAIDGHEDFPDFYNLYLDEVDESDQRMKEKPVFITPSPGARLMAAGVDFMPCGLLGLWLFRSPFESYDGDIKLILLSMFCLLCPLLESSPFGNTFGKAVFGLKLLTNNLKVPSARRIWLRALYTFVYFAGLLQYYIFADKHIDLPISSLLQCLLISFVLYLLAKGRHPHDFFSGTRILAKNT